jgi:hypothetical protein
MHRELIKCPDDKEVDHINRNTLDNRKSNLRICNRTQNNYNSKKRNRQSNYHPQSKYKGVRYVFCIKPDGRKYTRRKPWAASGRLNSKNVHLGYYTTEEEAAKKYDEFAIKHYGEFARLNFGDNDEKL